MCIFKDQKFRNSDLEKNPLVYNKNNDRIQSSREFQSSFGNGIKLMGLSLVPWLNLNLCWLNQAIQIYSCEKWVSCNKRSQQFRFLCLRSACQKHHALEWVLSKNCASRDCQNIGGELWKVSVFFTSAFSSSWGMAQTSIQVLIYLLDCCCYHHMKT